MIDALRSSKTDNWATPQDLFDQIAESFDFDIDLAASAENAKCDKYFDESADSLSQEWTGICWLNPPYGRAIGVWIRKAYEAGRNGATVVCLIPARTDTRWWHDYVKHSEHVLLKGRLKFGDGKCNAPFPSAVVVFRPMLEDVL